jgi:hemerythrin-like domain-containing protein
MESHMDAVQLLKEDHRTVESHFQEFERAGSGGGSRKGELCTMIAHELQVHTKIEEEIFYPAMESHERQLITEARKEHQQVDQILGELQRLQPTDQQLDSKMRQLIQDVKHHVQEEEGQLFPAAERELGHDRLRTLGEQMQRRKQELMRSQRAA